MSAVETSAARRLGWLTVALAALVVALLCAAVVLGLRWRDARAEQHRYDDVLAAARAETVAFTTLDYHNLNPSIDRVLAGATGGFKKQFAASREQLTSLSTRNKSVSKGRVLSAGVVSMDQDSARVAVVADSTVTNVNAPTPQPRHYRLALDLVLQDGQWRTSDLQFVG
jgi:Mce-associated membrane protein